MKKSLLTIVFGAILLVTACDQAQKTAAPTQLEQATTQSAQVPETQPTQPTSASLKKLAAEKMAQAAEQAKFAQAKANEAKALVAQITQKRDEMHVELAKGTAEGNRLVEQKAAEIIAANETVEKLVEQSKAASAISYQLSSEAREISQKANELEQQGK